MDVAQENQRSRVRHSLLLQEVLHELRIVTILLLSNDSLQLLNLVTFSRCLNIFMVDLLITRRINQTTQEQINSLIGTDSLKYLDTSRNGESLVVLYSHIDNNLQIRSIVT